MAGEANIWNPRALLAISGDTKSVEERLTATANQTLFTLTDFVYVVGTGALEVHKNGLLLTKNVDWVEQTDTTFSLLIPATAGDQIIATGHVAITGDVDVRDTDIFLANNQALRDYAGTEETIYIKGNVTAGDGGEQFFQLFTGAAIGAFLDDDADILLPTGGNGSIAWVSNTNLSRIARTLNVPFSALINAVDRSKVLGPISHIYDASTQVTYEKPLAVGIGEFIISVSGDQLTTTANTYTMIAVDATAYTMTLANALADPFVRLGSTKQISDRDYRRFKWVSGETPNGLDIIAHDTLSLQIKLIGTQSISVESLGAVTGTDISAEMQKAVDILSIFGGEVTTNGNYELIQVTVSKDHVTFKLNGSIDVSNATTSPIFFNDAFTGGKVLGGEILGVKTPITSFDGVIQFGTTTNTKNGGHSQGLVQGVHIHDISSIGVLVYNQSENVLVDHCHIHDVDNCVGFFKNSTNCKITNNLLERTYTGDDIDGIYHHVHGIYLRGWNHQASNNTIRNCGGYAVNCNDDSNEGSGVHIISSNHMYGCRDGAMLIVQGTSVIAESNYMYLNHAQVTDTVTTSVLDKWGVSATFGDDRIEAKLDWTKDESDFGGPEKGTVAVWGGDKNVDQRTILSNNIIEDNFTKWQIFVGDTSVANPVNELHILGGSILGDFAVFTNTPIANALVISGVEIRTNRMELEVSPTGIMSVSGNITIDQQGEELSFGLLINGGNIGKFEPNITCTDLAGTNYPAVVLVQGTVSGKLGGVVKIGAGLGSAVGVNRSTTLSGVNIASNGQVDVTTTVIGNGGSGREDNQNGITFTQDALNVNHLSTVIGSSITGVWAGVMNTKVAAPALSNACIIQNANQSTHNPTGGATITLNNLVIA